MNARGIALEGAWTPAEVNELHRILAPLPAAWIEHNDFLRAFVRRDVLRNGPPNAPGHSMYDPDSRSVVLFNKGVYRGDQIDAEQFRRSVYHELAHSILRLEPSLVRAFTTASKGDGFVDNYAQTAPDEDFCDSFSEYLIEPDATARAVPRKAQFLAELQARAGGEKTAMSFIDAFADELVKTGSMLPEGLLSRLKGKLPGAARLAVAGGVAGVAGHALGKHKGERKGIEEGTAMTGDVAQRAYSLGVQRGATAVRDALARQLQERER